MNGRRRQVTGYVQYDIMYKLWKHARVCVSGCGGIYVILALKRQRQDRWGSLGSQFNLRGKLQAVRNRVSEEGGGILEDDT